MCFRTVNSTDNLAITRNQFIPCLHHIWQKALCQKPCILSNMLSRPHAAKKQERELGQNITTFLLKMFFRNCYFSVPMEIQKLNQRN